MKLLLLTSFSIFMTFAPSAIAGSEADRLRKVLAKRDHEIVELRKEIDALHRQLADEQPQVFAKKQPSSDKAPQLADKRSISQKNQITHVVVAGDTLSRIAKRHGTSVREIKKINGLKSHIIHLGQKLKVNSDKFSTQAAAMPTIAEKTKDARPPAIESQKSREYRIKAGDTFYSIARREGITIKQLKSLNPNTDSSKLRIGQRISLGDSVAKSSENTTDRAEDFRVQEQPVTAASNNNSSQKSVSKVIADVELNKEMTFEDFAKQHGMSMERLNELNGHNLAANEWLAVGSVFYVEK